MKKRIIYGFLTVFLFVVFSLSGIAQTIDEEAKMHYKQAVVLFQEGNYKMALAEFKKSYDLKPNWKLKLSIGICYFNMNKFVEARKELLEYLEEGGQNIPKENETQAKDLLSQISKLVASFTVEANVLGAKIILDGNEIGTTPMKKPYAVEAGLYKVKVVADGYKPYEKELTLAGGDSKELDVVLVPLDKTETSEKAEKVEKVDVNAKQSDLQKQELKKQKQEEKKTEVKGIEKEGKSKRKLNGLAIGAIATGVVAAGGWGGVAGLGVKVLDLGKKFDDCNGNRDCEEKYKSDGDKYRNIVNFALIPAAAVLSVASISLGVISAIKGKKGQVQEKEKSAYFIRNFSISSSLSDGGGITFIISGNF